MTLNRHMTPIVKQLYFEQERTVESRESNQEQRDRTSSSVTNMYPSSPPRNEPEEEQRLKSADGNNLEAVFALYQDDTAPVDFQVVSDSDDDENFDQLLASPVTSTAVFVDKVACPLCRRRRQRLTCTECLKRGDFYIQNRGYRNSSQVQDKYAELKSKYLKTQEDLDKLKLQCASFTTKKERLAIIMDEIEKCQTTICLQQQLKDVLQSKIDNANRESDFLKTKTEKDRRMFPTFRSRLDNMQSQYRHNCSKLEKNHLGVRKRQDNLAHGTKSRIIQLRNHVFPIEEMNQGNRSGHSHKGIFGSNSQETWSDDEDDTVNALMNAKSNYWSRPDELVSTFGTCYTITGPSGPTLPATGDYTAYNMWADRNQAPGVTAGGVTNRNPAHCIAASLTYTTEFVNLIAYYLDLRLPHRLSYSEFTNGDLSTGKFNRKVAKLNANVIHLCSSQGISATYLQPRKTIPNLLLLFDQQAQLGRRGPFEVASQLAKSMEDSIEKDLVIYEGAAESDTEWSDSTFPSDWETINRGAICEEFGLQEMKAAECLSPTMSYLSDSLYRSRSTNSLTGNGLLSSVTSFFRGWNK